MSIVIAFPSAGDRGDHAFRRALTAFEIDCAAGIEQMVRLALGHDRSECRDRAARWLAEVLDVAIL